MMGYWNLLAFLLLFTILTLCNAKLVQVVSFFRHGSRYAINSLYDGNETRYIWGELTSTGMRQHQTLGEILKKEYMDQLGFLSSSYNRNQIEVYSTEVNRTIQSVLSQLYGLYPLGTGPKLIKVSPQLHLPPYSNSTDLPETTFALPSGHQPIPPKFNQQVMMDSCTHQSSWQEKNIQLQLDEYRQMNTTYWPFLKRIAGMFGLTGNVTLSTLASLNGDVDCDLYLGRRIPEGFTGEDRRNLRHLDSWYKQLVIAKDLAKAMNKDRLTKILSVFDSRLSNPQQPLKWTFLSGHDSDMCAMYNDLNLTSTRCIEELYRTGKTSELNCQQYPQFTASLIFQLYVEGTRSTVKVRSNGRYVNLCGERSTECLYEDWRKKVKSNMASDELAETICGKKVSMLEENENEGLTLNQKLQARTLIMEE